MLCIVIINPKIGQSCAFVKQQTIDINLEFHQRRSNSRFAELRLFLTAS